jgi:general secretion pathway protein M
MNGIAAWFAELAPRERRLLKALGVVFGVMLVVLASFGTNALLGSRREENAALRDAVSRVQAGRSAVKIRQARRDAVAARYARKAPKLGGFLEGLGKEHEVDIPESQDKPEVPIGKRYVERATTLRLRKVAGYPLVKFLEGVEKSGHPVAITRLNLRKRAGEHDSFDVELGVSAYDRNEPAAPAASGSAAPPAAPPGVP